jgi:phosphoglycolate phosphatase
VNWIRPPARPPLAELFDGVDYVLFDFDGPLVDLFAGRQAQGIASRLLDLLSAELLLGELDFSDPTDPHGMVAELRSLLRRHPARSRSEVERLVSATERALVREERTAAKSAVITEGADALVGELIRQGRGLAITSNNAPEAIRAFLALEQSSGLRAAFQGHIYGRNPDPDFMKPDPDCVARALDGLGCRVTDRCLMIGDSESDFKAAASAKVRFLGFAPTERTEARLRAAGVRHLIAHLDELCWAPRL